jgi:tetratricopeptide (TPR) repeat protein
MSTTPRAARAFAAAALVAALAGCAGGARYPAMPSPEQLPPESPLRSRTLGPADAWLRWYLMTGRPDSAARLLAQKGVAPRDVLLRRLQMGVVMHEAGRWAESNAELEWAEREAEDRYARSVRQQVGRLLVNDGVADFTPARPEMAMIPYYRMLNYLALGQKDEALVEARKAGAWIERVEDGGRPPCLGEGFVEYVAGLVYQAHGERNDALVAFRQAERSFDACRDHDATGRPAQLGEDLVRAAQALGMRDVADSARARYGVHALPAAPGPGSGELVVLVEQGWVAHRAGQDIHVPIDQDSVRYLDGRGEAVTESFAEQLSGRLYRNLMERSVWGESLDDRPDRQVAEMAEGAYVMRLAWPVYRLEACGTPRVRVVVGDTAVADSLAESEEPAAAEDLSSQVVRAFEATRPALFTRMVARGLAKYAVSHELETRARKKGGEFAGWLTGAVTNAAGNVLERADTRSWSLLPDRIGVARFSLPAGSHRVRVQTLAPDGSVAATVDLGVVDVAAGATVFRSERVWGREMGDMRRLAHLGQQAGGIQ